MTEKLGHFIINICGSVFRIVTFHLSFEGGGLGRGMCGV